MPTISITDDAQNPVTVPFKLTPPPALFKYLKSEIVHLIASHDFIEFRDKTLTQVAPEPAHFQLQLGNTFQLGNTTPEIQLTPSVHATLTVNATQGANIFDEDLFANPTTVPVGTAYVGLTLDGSLDLGISGSAGDLTFGIHRNTGITLGYWRACPTGAGQPTLGDAFGDILGNFVIATDLADVSGLQQHDIYTVSGAGTLKVCGGVTVTAIPNPLASVNLPLNVGKCALQQGLMAGLTTSFAITGSYQVRVRRMNGALIELSFLKRRGTALKTEFTAGGGIAVNVGSTDLPGKLLGAIDPDTDNGALLTGGLTAEEVETITSGIKSGIDHSLQVAVDESLSLLTDDEAAFQYQIDVAAALADPIAKEAVHRALKGDLSRLAALEDAIHADGSIAPGVKLLKSVLATSRKKEITLKLNLLGIVNLISVSDLIRSSKVVQDAVTGDITITDSATATTINAIMDPLKRHEALRKLMFDSLMVTAAYAASGASASFRLALHDVHSALKQNTGSETVRDYLRWFVALNLMTDADQQQMLPNFTTGGASTCVLRTQFTDAQCRSMFLDTHGDVRPKEHYLDLSRRAMMALLDTSVRANKVRYDLLENHWKDAFEIGPNAGLPGIVGLSTADSQYLLIESLMVGDVYDITWWASGMVDAGIEVRSMLDFVAGRNPILLANDDQFKQHRDNLQRKMATMVGRSKARFQEPWGMISLFWAAGSQGVLAKLATSHLVLVKP